MCIRDRTYIYAYYDDNEKEVDNTRRELEEAIREAIGISDDHFLKLGESKKLKEYIEAALEVLAVSYTHLDVYKRQETM